MHRKPLTQTELVASIKDAFTKSPASTRKAVKATNNLLAYITNDTLTNEQYKNIYFYILRGLNTEDIYLKSMLYSAIKELKSHTNESFLATNSLTKDLNSDTQHIIKAKGLTTLFVLIPPAMINDFEKYITQAFVSRFEPRRDAAVLVSLLSIKDNKENVRRWSMNLNLLQGVSIKDYHTLTMLSYIKDRNGLEKICQDYRKFKGQSGVVLVNILAQLSRSDVMMYVDLFNKLLRSNDECVCIETARVISKMEDSSLFIDAVLTTLRPFLKSSKKSIKFAAMRIISALSASSDKVKIINKEIEELVGHSNRTLSMMAITTLLKTGTEDTIERLVGLIPGIINDMSDSFKIIVISALENLSSKFQAKERVFLEFINNALNEKGTLTFKRYIIKVMERIAELNPKLNEQILDIIAFYIEDSQNYILTMDILALIGQIIGNVDNYKRYLVHVLNRLIIDNSYVKCSALQALYSISMKKPELKNQVTNILVKYTDSEDELVSAEAKLLLKYIDTEKQGHQQKFCLNDLGDLKEDVMEFLGEDYVEEEVKEIVPEKVVVKMVKTTRELMLTEKNADFTIFVTKAIYGDRIILKFRMLNMLENISFKRGKLILAINTGKDSYKAEVIIKQFNEEFVIEKAVNINQNFVENLLCEEDCELLSENIFKVDYSQSIVLNAIFAYELYADQDYDEVETETLSLKPFNITFMDFISPAIVYEEDHFKTKKLTLNISGSLNEVRQKINLKFISEEQSPLYKLNLAGTIEEYSVVVCFTYIKANMCEIEIKTDSEMLLDKMVEIICE